MLRAGVQHYSCHEDDTKMASSKIPDLRNKKHLLHGLMPQVTKPSFHIDGAL